MTGQKIRLGIIGVGAQGGIYADLLHEGRVGNTVLGAICDTDESKRAVADSYGVPFFTDYVELLDSGVVDAVVTTVPHYLHPEMGIAALNAASTRSSRSPPASTPSRCADCWTSPPRSLS